MSLEAAVLQAVEDLAKTYRARPSNAELAHDAVFFDTMALNGHAEEMVELRSMQDPKRYVEDLLTNQG